VSQLTATQVADCAAQAANHLFSGRPPSIGGAALASINANWTQIQTNASALDAALDTTINAAATAGFGADSVINALAAQLTAPISGWTAQQKTILLCFVLMKRVGLI
jgi:hypothetical protein